LAEWTTDVTGQLLQSLADEFAAGPLLADGTRSLDEDLVAQLDGLKIYIFANEHPPPHFRVSHQGDSNDFDICTGAALYDKGLNRWRRNVRKWHDLNKESLIRWWDERRPTNCPVGKAKC
jgi:hypothetical protein